MFLGLSIGQMILIFIGIIILFGVIAPSIRNIGPTEVGLVMRRFGKKLPGENPIAFKNEAGYEAKMLMPGFRFKLWLLYNVTRHPWVQVPPGEIGIAIAQIGEQLPQGAKSAIYKSAFGNFVDLEAFIRNGGQKGIQRKVLGPGTLVPIHPIGFLVITRQRVYGAPIDAQFRGKGQLTFQNFGLTEEQLKVFVLKPEQIQVGEHSKTVVRDVIGIVTVLEGNPLPPGDIASRLGAFVDIAEMEKKTDTHDMELIEQLLGSKNNLHNNYQDFQAFLDNDGRIGLQHDPLLYGSYTLNPFLIKVERAPMLVVEQGEVAVIKAYVGLSSEDTSGTEFKFGSLVRPGHRGIWREPLRTGKYAINPNIYQYEIVPTSILNLNWADATSTAHKLDANLKQIDAKSREGFVFKIDLQVQIHVPDTQAPKVISMVGTMLNLVNEVLQAAVGNHFRDKLQSMPAIVFIETRQQVQEEAMKHISEKLADYHVETRGVYIQDVILPEQLVKVLTSREIANQEIQTYQKQQEAEVKRIDMEKAKGIADKQAELAGSEVGIIIMKNKAEARKVEGDGEASYLTSVGTARGVEVRAVGMANAEAYQKQVDALGAVPTAIVNAIKALAEKGIKIMPDVLVAGGGGSLEGLAATFIKKFSQISPEKPASQEKETLSKKVL
ncbi:MAG: hypothetical protein A2V69_03970 [Candidatus Portnoybacteria bacterium RBG_13_40_8]|uniref:Band 7 domain-containing protein n=1 Tax=Candidatus Portnoybacteria bacterium RBG_13_40_8 TaxID=1801990 RepID=A0A1G2F657_9BACT|nr:MAG: hypothetical protein A2V69_03970 [Candidatus Portnoybacteria bacterium RBG_13_40_8]